MRKSKTGATPAEYILTRALKEISVALKEIANRLEVIENLQRGILKSAADDSDR